MRATGAVPMAELTATVNFICIFRGFQILIFPCVNQSIVHVTRDRGIMGGSHFCPRLLMTSSCSRLRNPLSHKFNAIDRIISSSDELFVSPLLTQLLRLQTE